MSQAPNFVIADWGTSNLRIYRVDESGKVLDSRASGQGILHIQNRQFAAALEALCMDWRDQAGQQAILMAGMIGSRQGWREAPYARCPVRLADLAGLCVTLAGPHGWPVQIAPGVSMQRLLPGEPALPQADVMRGEEVQVFGAAELIGLHDDIICLPGTHSKWVWLRDGAIAEFATFLSGELYAVLCQHTILGRLIPEHATDNTKAFDRGLAVAWRSSGVLSALFSARADCLLELIEPSWVPSYLSGLLIGAELAELGPRLPPGASVVLIGSDNLIPWYQRALQQQGHPARTVSAREASIAGLLALNRIDPL